jgi:hypothetical protein
VPPRGCFAQQDRTHNPVILPTRQACKNGYKLTDQSVGQFLSLLNGKRPKPDARGVRYAVSSVPGVAVNKNVNPYGAVERWVRAFHGALYSQPIPAKTKFTIELPLDVLSADDETGPESVDRGRPEQRALCKKTLAVARTTGTIDRVVGWKHTNQE